ncbi:MAG: ABC transporter permease [Saprospiraceae bacterium]
MWQNYLKIALRNLWKNRTFTLVNVIGVGFSLAAFLFILEYISFERNVNNFHVNLPNLYRLMYQGSDGKAYGWTRNPLPSAMQQQFKEVKGYCRIVPSANVTGIITYSADNTAEPPRSFHEENIIFADQDFFKLFSFKVLEGKSSLEQPNLVAIAASQAKKYFANENPIGKVLILNNQFGKALYTVSAVFEDVPQDSDLQFDMVFSLATLANPVNLNGNDWARLDTWGSTYLHGYVMLEKNTDIAALEKQATAIVKQNLPSFDQQIILQPMRYMHLGRNLNDNNETFGNLGFIYLIGSIGLLILIIAWLNYINLSTASSLKRAKEVGIRKVVGANRSQLIGQFLGESFLLNLYGFALAIIIVKILQTPFNQLIGKNLSLNTLLQNSSWLFGTMLVVSGLVISGTYVAYVLSSFSTAYTLKGTFSRSLKGVFLRKSLVVFQFTISLILIAATLILYRQLQFMQNKSLGMNIEQKVVITGPEIVEEGTYQSKNAAYLQAVSQFPFVKKYSSAGVVPGKWYNWSMAGITRLNPKPDDDKKNYNMAIIDDRYFDLYDIKFAVGNNFTPFMCEQGWDKAKRVILNEKAAKELGFASAQEAVGQQVTTGEPFEIIGVVKDYHHMSLQQAIEPIIFLPRLYSQNITLELPTDQIQTSMRKLESLYKQTFPGNPFEYFFVDDAFNEQYKTEQQYGLIFMIASGLAILISCLGLFGLATFSVEQKTKEIGIRKVMGASVEQIVTLLTQDFLILVGIAFVIATPLAWWMASKWLEDFAYRTELSWWIFGIAGAMAGLIAIITVSFHAVKAAVANPVESLKSE